jgi:acetyl-CoA synthetase
MRDYQAAYREFSLENLEREVLQGSLVDGLNACIECCDRRADDDQRIALTWISRDFVEETVTFRELALASARFANLLHSCGVGRGDVVAGLLPRIPELFVAVLGCFRAGAIYQPLFTAFGPAAIERRVTAESGTQAKLILTDAANRPKLDEVARCPPVLLVDRGQNGKFAVSLVTQPETFAPVMLRRDDPFVTIFTSGTTGHPKAVRYPLRGLLGGAAYMRDAIELRTDDRFWCMADPGWSYGMFFTIVVPLLLGHATTMYEGPFTVESAVRVIDSQAISNVASAPTAYRLMMAAGDDAVAPISRQLRVASSVGEALNPEVARWAERALNCPLYDHYGQTEVGMIVTNHHGLRHDVKPGSAGLATPGYELAVLDDSLRPVPPGTPGTLAVNVARSPLCVFSGYWREETPNLRGEWCLTGDTMRREEDGHFYFVARADDIITSAGYRIGPFEIESALMEHPAIAEVAVVGKPDPERTEIVKAFAVLRQGFAPSAALIDQLQQHVRKRLSLHAYPREIEFLAEMPKTPSGKMQRFLLRQRP